VTWHQILGLFANAGAALGIVVAVFLVAAVTEYLLMTRGGRGSGFRRMTAARCLAFLVTCVMLSVRVVRGRKAVQRIADKLSGGDEDA